MNQIPLGHDTALSEKKYCSIESVWNFGTVKHCVYLVIFNFWLNMIIMESNDTFKFLIFVIPVWHFLNVFIDSLKEYIEFVFLFDFSHEPSAHYYWAIY